MREIKFRGKRLDNGKWVYGDLMRNICGTRIVRYKESKTEIGDRADWEYIDVDNNTIGQFTGVYDKYGKEVYEGDMLYIKEYDNVAFGESEEFKNAFDLEELKGELKTQYEGVVKWDDGDVYVEMSNFSLYMGTLFGNQKNSQPIFDFYITGNIHEGEC